ncbi:MAG: deoxyribonuclease IV [Actinomycetota bacterium]|nr:deoxyribonuclease IV [Actinomycetota bacterium]
MVFGGHCSGGVKKAIARAEEIGADALQLFVQSPRAWRFPEHDAAVLDRFRDQRPGATLVHALYLVNLASPEDEIYEKSIATMRSTVDTACAISADAVVFHVGSHLGAGFDTGLARAVPAIEQVLERCRDNTWLLLENSAGAGRTIGRSIDELAVLVDRLGKHERLGICLDSCHLYVSGWDVTDAGILDRLVTELDDRIGLDRLRAIHVNDAAAPLGSNRDRHANVGEGLMGEQLGVFLAHRAFQALPAVLEVPGKDGHGPDADEVRKLRELHARWA